MNHKISASNLVGLKQQRKGTSTPKKRSAMKMSGVFPADGTRDSLTGNDPKRLSWLEKVRRRSIVLTNKGKIFLENRFSGDFHGIYSARFSADGEKVVTAYGVGAIQVWHIESDDHCVTIKTTPHHGYPIMCVRLHPTDTNNHFFAGGCCGNIYVCGMKAGDYKNFAKEEANEVNSLDLSLDGETLVSGGKDAILRIYDVNTAKITHKILRSEDASIDDHVMRFHRMRVFAVKFHHASREVFLSGGWDDCVKVWDTRVNQAHVRDIRGPHICGESLDIRDNVVLTGSWTVENSLQIWDLTSGKLIDNINPVNRTRTIDGEFLYCCQFFAGDSTGNVAVTGGSGIGRVEVIDLAERRVISSFKVHKTIQAIDTTSNYMVFGGMESMFRVATI